MEREGERKTDRFYDQIKTAIILMLFLIYSTLTMKFLNATFKHQIGNCYMIYTQTLTILLKINFILINTALDVLIVYLNEKVSIVHKFPKALCHYISIKTDYMGNLGHSFLITLVSMKYWPRADF